MTDQELKDISNLELIVNRLGEYIGTVRTYEYYLASSSIENDLIYNFNYLLLEPTVNTATPVTSGNYVETKGIRCKQITNRKTNEDIAYTIETTGPVSTNSYINNVMVYHLKDFGEEKFNAAVQAVLQQEFVVCDTQSALLTKNVRHRFKLFKNGNAFIILTNILDRLLLANVVTTCYVLSGYNLSEELQKVLLPIIDTDKLLDFVTKACDLDRARRNKLVHEIPKILNNVLIKNTKNILDRKIERYQADIESYTKRIQDMYYAMRKLQRSMLTDEETKSVTELIDYLLKYELDHIKDIRITRGSNITFVIEEPLLYWFEDDFNTLVKHRSSNINAFSELTNNAMGFLTAIFVDKRYTINLRTSVMINVPEENSMYISRGETPCAGYIGNPHIRHYDCWGDNGPLLSKAASSGDTVGYWQILKSTLSSINLADAPVLRKFTNEILSAISTVGYCKNTVIDNNTGEVITISSAYKQYLNEQETNTEQEGE